MGWYFDLAEIAENKTIMLLQVKLLLLINAKLFVHR